MITFLFAGRRLVILLVAVLLTGTVHGDARSAYRQGLEALQAERFAEAAEAFRTALGERPDAKVGLFREYLPHYHLGVALAQQDQCAAAMAAWDEAERQGEVRKSSAADQLDGWRSRCATRLDRLDRAARAAAAAEPTFLAVQEEAIRVARLREAAVLERVWSDGAPSFEERQREGLRRLGQARRALQAAAAAGDPEGAAAARERGEEVIGHFRQLAEDAEAVLADLGAVLDSEIEALELIVERAEATLITTRELRPYPRRLGLLVAKVESAVRAAGRREADAPPARLRQLRDALAGEVDRLEEAARRPPRDLMRAVRAHLAGRPQDVLMLLDGAEFDDPRAEGQACLLRAASRQAISFLDQDAAAVLEDELLRCASLGAVAPERFFSPRFLALYRPLVGR